MGEKEFFKYISHYYNEQYELKTDHNEENVENPQISANVVPEAIYFLHAPFFFLFCLLRNHRQMWY